MADAVHNPSRRAVLGAAVGLPLASSVGSRLGPLHHPSGGPPPRAGEDFRWSRAVDALEEAWAAVREAEGRSAGLAFAEAEALQGAYDQRCEAYEGALRRVLRVPAPDVGAFAAKILLAIDHDVGSLSGGAACLKAVRRDAMRFAQSITLREG